jgi:hypothetical protein
VEDRCVGGEGEVRPVVHGPQLSVALCGVAEDGQKFQLLAGLEGLVAKLDDIDAPGESGIQELSEITTVFPAVGAQIELSVIVVHVN